MNVVTRFSTSLYIIIGIISNSPFLTVLYKKLSYLSSQRSIQLFNVPLPSDFLFPNPVYQMFILLKCKLREPMTKYKSRQIVVGKENAKSFCCVTQVPTQSQHKVLLAYKLNGSSACRSVLRLPLRLCCPCQCSENHEAPLLTQ